MKFVLITIKCGIHPKEGSISFYENEKDLDFWIKEYQDKGCYPVVTECIITK